MNRGNKSIVRVKKSEKTKVRGQVVNKCGDIERGDIVLRDWNERQEKEE